MAELSGTGLAVMVGGGLVVYVALKDIGFADALSSIISGTSPAGKAKIHKSSFTDLQPSVDAILSAGPGTAPGAGAGGALQAGMPLASNAIAAATLKYLGVPYHYGGTSPAGFDCSGLVFYVLAHDLGMVGVPRTVDTFNLWPGATTIGESQAGPGDLVLWPYGLGPNAHMGVVVSPGQFVNAPGTGSVVRVDAIPSTLHGGPPVYRRVNTLAGAAVVA